MISHRVTELNCGAWPRRQRSPRPMRRLRRNRPRQRSTRRTGTPSRPATSRALPPPAHARIILARAASRWELVGARTRRLSSASSSGVSSRLSGGRPRLAEVPTSGNYTTGTSPKCPALFPTP
jgi:hypothetical protein